MSAAFARLRSLLVTRPYSSNAVLAGVLMLAGDRLAPRAEASSRERADAEAAAAPEAAPLRAAPPQAAAVRSAAGDWGRTAILVSWASGASVFWSAYYSFLHTRLPRRYLLWVVLTAAVPAPAVNAAFFSYSTALDELRRGRDAAAAARAVDKKLRSVWLPTVVVSTQFWSFTNYANFALVPHELRVVVGATAALVWNAFLSAQQSSGAGGTKAVPFFWSPRVLWEEGRWPRIVADDDEAAAEKAK